MTNRREVPGYIIENDFKPIIQSPNEDIKNKKMVYDFLHNIETEKNQKIIKKYCKITMTNETLNREINRSIIIKSVIKKLKQINGIKYKNQEDIFLLAKMINSDIISKFKVLRIFKNQKILNLKEILDSLYLKIFSEIFIDKNSSTYKEKYYKCELSLK